MYKGSVHYTAAVSLQSHDKQQVSLQFFADWRSSQTQPIKHKCILAGPYASIPSLEHIHYATV